MRPFVANWQDAAGRLFARVYRESVGRVVDEKAQGIAWGIIRLSRCDARVEESCRVALHACHSHDIKGDRFLNHFSMVMTVNTPQTVAAQEMCIEWLFPADAATACHHIALMSAG